MKRPATFFIMALLTLLLAACGGGGGGSPTTTTTPPSGTNPGTPPPPPPAPSPAQLTSACPADNANPVGLNSHIRASFDKAIDSASFPIDAVTLDCGGMLITGQSVLNVDTIAFAPDTALPAGQPCSVNLDPGITDTEGVAIGNQSWNFETGNRDEVAFNFEVPRSLVTQTSSYIRKTIKQGDDIAIFWALGLDLYVTISRDGGQTFTTSAPISPVSGFGSVQEVDARIANGVIHVVWRVVPSSGEILYTRSTDFTTFSIPLLLTDPFDSRTAVNGSLSVDTNGNLHIAWLEDCLTFSTCDSSTLGVYTVASTDNGISFGAVTRISTQFASLPLVAAIDSQSLISWVENGMLSLYPYPAPGAPYASLSETGERFWPYQLESGNANNLFIHWSEGQVGQKNFYLARYSGLTNTVTNPGLIAQEATSEFPRVCSRITPESDAVLYWMKGAYTLVTPATAIRKLHLSTDSGNNFLYPQVLDFMIYARRGSGGVADIECPNVLPVQNGEILLVWDRFQFTTPPRWDLMIAKGTPGAPCDGQ
jgi:hypothetical protein